MQSNEQAKPELPELTSGQVARQLGTTTVTVRALTERGQLPGWRIGTRYKYARRDVENFLTKSERPLAA
jgi:excisionase family DNA binding protein